MQKRSFTVLTSSICATGGRYISSSPEAAAKKAGRQLFRKKEEKCLTKKNNSKITFTIIETTRGSGGARNNEPREYTVTRTKKKNPETFVRGGVEITVNYDYNIVAGGVVASTSPTCKTVSPRRPTSRSPSR